MTTDNMTIWKPCNQKYSSNPHFQRELVEAREGWLVLLENLYWIFCLYNFYHNTASFVNSSHQKYSSNIPIHAARVGFISIRVGLLVLVVLYSGGLCNVLYQDWLCCIWVGWACCVGSGLVAGRLCLTICIAATLATHTHGARLGICWAVKGWKMNNSWNQKCMFMH